MTTVLTLAPFGAPVDIMPFELGGEVTNGRTVVPVNYNNFGGTDTNVLDGVNQLDAKLVSLSGQTVIVFGYSLGAVVISRWLNDKGPAASTTYALPANVSFICIGNSVRKYGGILQAGLVGDAVKYLSQFGAIFNPVVAPSGTPYTVTDFARQYDGYADWPNALGFEAVNNALQGQNVVHPNYFNVSLTDPNNVSYVEGNITYIWSPTFPVPEVGTITDAFSIPKDQDKRPSIEGSYLRAPGPGNRPVAIPDPPQWNLLTPKIDLADLTVAQKAILSDNPIAASSAAYELAVKSQTPSTDIEVTLYDKFYKGPKACGDYKSLEFTFARNQMGTATLVLKHDDPLVSTVMQCYKNVIPVTIKSGYLKWTGRVEYVDKSFKADKEGGSDFNVTCYLTNDYQWFDKILCWPDFLLPIQFQFPSRALYIGPAITCIKTLISEQTFRIQSGIWEFINNALSLNEDWRTWVGTLLESDGNLSDMLMTPIVVVPTNPLYDTSPWTSINGRMDKVSTLVDQVVKDNGLVLSADLWLPGDPQPANLSATLTNPTIIVDVKDRSGVTGPSGTFIDGLVKDAVDLEHSLLGNVLSPFLNPNNEFAPEGVNIAPALGVNFVPPWVLFNDHPRGGLTEYHLIPHSPLAHTIIGGGKSPHWINDLINATFEYAIDAIEIAVGFTGVPDTLLDGTFDDIILAFQLIENADRRIDLGPYGFPEFFQQTGASAYTIDEWFALQSAMWDTRGYHGVILGFDDGYPYVVGKDIFVGSLASFATGGMLFTDYVERITIKDSPEERRKAEVMIGDGKSHEDPVVKIQRKITKFEEAVNIITMSQ